MIFSELSLELPGKTHPLYELRDQLKNEGAIISDLVRGNPNEHGVVFPPDQLKQILSAAAQDAQIYRPDSFGQICARKAISEHYTKTNIPPRQIILTPGTSLSYWYCFKLLAEVGEEILCPQPSYPLLDYIAKLSGVTLTYYKLVEEKAAEAAKVADANTGGGKQWTIDLADLERKISGKTRAIVLISPHNPTGMVCSANQIEELVSIARARDLPIISDEVFSDFIFEEPFLARPTDGDAPLVFTLNGLSKSLALPGLKLGWICVSGDEWLVKRSLNALEIFSDTFLPVNEISQFAAHRLLEEGAEFQKRYTNWVRAGRNLTVNLLRDYRLDFAPPQGGFYLTLPVQHDEEKLAQEILAKEKILVHPGHFYDIAENHIVFTFVQEHRNLKDCLDKLLPYLH